MLMSEFIERTGFQPTADEYQQIEDAYMMASANKFLRIYYASVNAYLDSLEHD